MFLKAALTVAWRDAHAMPRTTLEVVLFAMLEEVTTPGSEVSAPIFCMH